MCIRDRFLYRHAATDKLLVMALYSFSDMISVQISDGGATPTAGQNYTLTCSVSRVENFNPIIAYQWTKNNGTEIQVGTNSNTLSFSPLRLTDVGRYTCEVTISSLFLNSDITMPSSDSRTLALQSECVSFASIASSIL